MRTALLKLLLAAVVGLPLFPLRTVAGNSPKIAGQPVEKESREELIAESVDTVALLTLTEARTRACDNYPAIKRYDLIALTKQFTLDNAAKAWLPQVAVGVQGTWQTAVAGYPDALKGLLEQRGMDIKGMSRLQWKAAVDVTQTVWDGGRIRAAKHVAQRRSEEDRLENEVELYKLKAVVDELFFGILLLEKQTEALTASTDLLTANLEKVRSWVRHGAAMQSDADAIEAELLTAQQQLLSVAETIVSYRSVLSLYTGVRADVALAEPARIAPSLDNVGTLRPEQRLFDAGKAVIAARKDELMASTKPQLGVFAQGYYGYPGLNFMDAMMTREPKLNAMVGISLKWDLSAFYTKKNKLSTLEASANGVDVMRDVFEFGTKVEAERQRSELKRLKQVAEADAHIVALRKRVRQASEARLREGIVEPTDLLLRITEEKNALIAANTRRIEYLRALYRLQNMMND